MVNKTQKENSLPPNLLIRKSELKEKLLKQIEMGKEILQVKINVIDKIANFFMVEIICC